MDFILLKFNTAVDLTSMFLNVYDVSQGTNDSDATVFYQNGATAPASNGTTQSTTYFNQFTSISVPGGSSDGARTVDVGGNFSDTWLVSAGVNSNSNDGFKLYSITVNTPTGGVPEPASWALMIMGFGGIGGALRSRRKAVFA